MKLLSYTLKGYVPFKFSKIEKLELNYPEDIQIILGTNGSGKSSYLRTLTPYPISRSLFEKDGYRKMVIEHDGHVYTLISDFSNKASPHQFIKDDEGDLNEGGTTGVQSELVERYFNLSKERESLLFGDVNFCDMSPGQVKPFLMKICPLDLSWILDKQKKTSSLLRNIKYALKELTARETQLLSELSSEEELEEMQKDKESYKAKITDLVSKQSAYQTRIDVCSNRIKELRSEALTSNSSSLEALEAELRIHNDKINTLRDNSQRITEWISSKGDKVFSRENLPKIDERKGRTEEALSSTMTKLKEIDANLDKSSTEDLEELTTKLTSLKETKKELESKIISDPLTPNEIQSVESNLPRLNELLIAIDHTQRKIWSRNYYLHKTRLYNRYAQKYASYSSQWEAVERRIRELQTQLNTGFDPNMDVCSKNKCVLYRYAVEKRSERELELSNLTEESRKLGRFVAKYKSYISGRSDNLRMREVDNQILEELFSLVSTCPQLKRYIKGDFLTVLSQTPHKLYRDIEEHVRSSYTTQRYKDTVEQIQGLERHLKDIDNISESYRSVLLEDKKKVEQSIKLLEDDLKDAYRDAEAKKWILESEALDAEKKVKEETYNNVKTIYSKIEDQEKEISGYRESLTPIELQLKQTVDTLTQIEMVLSSQEKIMSRYEEEVKARKEELEKKYNDLTELEYAQIEMPKQYMQNWLKALTEQVNRYISVVWNQQLELVIPKDDKDYKFTAIFKGDTIDNLSLCSSAQRDIINLCVCLALRSPVTSLDGIGMRGYPLALDETGATFDEAHKHNLIDLFTLLISEGIVSQIYLTSHHAVIHGALANIQTLVLNSDNIALPANYNQDVEIEYS